ncbi:WD40 repeat-like protein [Conidiobolus coronatus NRRL 28638]|uniref:WD40 repeat-like protein n=1 Tax=Conidiobolus coronatus (strain ATCC 28846 / CBS 209.66 / NRRL 28638) TaxID=796925 RepID=A0A137P9N0_CONC2|nr:WD40 repeat-like protein [Conidiobolus coronatus NRRL 28638]|eukprot:KXN71621.1 WD40 repeat-like protein [Conidiobolus coronatus NRRL 28638]
MVGALDYDELKDSSQIIALGTLSGKVILLKENSEIEAGFNTTKIIVTDQKVVSLKLTRYGNDGCLLLVYCINNYPKLYHINNQFEVKLISELEINNLHPMTINYSAELQHLAIGSRQGSLLIYSLAEDLGSATLLQNIPNLHKKESLTSLRYAATNLITCGRDGAYTILTPSTNYSVQLYSKITKGWLENIQLINNSPLISYFFQKRLHCLNLDTNEEVFSIACGGGHREWYLMPGDENLVKGSVVYLRKEKIIIYPIGSNDESNQNGGEFDLVLKGSLHGREIRTLTQTLDSDLLITGAEAGTLKLLQKSQNSLTSKLNLKAHSSVISKLSTIEFNSNTYLISAGGCEELKVWSINSGDLAMKEVFNSPIYSVDLEFELIKSCNDSAIQGIQFYDDYKLASISLDQRLNLWSINASSDSIKLELEYSKFSYVADPSDLQVLKSKEGKEGVEFGVVGIGLEVIELI